MNIDLDRYYPPHERARMSPDDQRRERAALVAWYMQDVAREIRRLDNRAQRGLPN